MKAKIALFVFLFVLLSACRIPVATEPIVYVQFTPTFVTNIGPTSTSQPNLSSPTFQPAPASPTVTVQILLTATQQVLHDKLDKYCKYGQAWEFKSSPDNHWDVVFCSYNAIQFVQHDETKHWEVSSDKLINPGVDYFISLDHWSNDGNYVYVSFNPHTDGYWEPYHQGIVLYRLDLQTGQISEVLPLRKSDWLFYSFAFSQNDRRLAYIVTDKSPVILNIQDMQTGDGQSFEFDPKYNTGGGFVWSPDSQQLVFSITQFDTNNYEYIATSIILWDRNASELTTLIKDHPSRMQALEWTDENTIVLQAEIFSSTETITTNYELDLESKELTEINP